MSVDNYAGISIMICCLIVFSVSQTIGEIPECTGAEDIYDIFPYNTGSGCLRIQSDSYVRGYLRYNKDGFSGGFTRYDYCSDGDHLVQYFCCKKSDAIAGDKIVLYKREKLCEYGCRNSVCNPPPELCVNGKRIGGLSIGPIDISENKQGSIEIPIADIISHLSEDQMHEFLKEIAQQSLSQSAIQIQLINKYGSVVIPPADSVGRDITKVGSVDIHRFPEFDKFTCECLRYRMGIKDTLGLIKCPTNDLENLNKFYSDMIEFYDYLQSFYTNIKLHLDIIKESLDRQCEVCEKNLKKLREIYADKNCEGIWTTDPRVAADRTWDASICEKSAELTCNIKHCSSTSEVSAVEKSLCPLCIKLPCCFGTGVYSDPCTCCSGDPVSCSPCPCSCDPVYDEKDNEVISARDSGQCCPCCVKQEWVGFNVEPNPISLSLCQKQVAEVKDVCTVDGAFVSGFVGSYSERNPCNVSQKTQQLIDYITEYVGLVPEIKEQLRLLRNDAESGLKSGFSQSQILSVIRELEYIVGKSNNIRVTGGEIWDSREFERKINRFIRMMDFFKPDSVDGLDSTFSREHTQKVKKYKVSCSGATVSITGGADEPADKENVEAFTDEVYAQLENKLLDIAPILESEDYYRFYEMLSEEWIVSCREEYPPKSLVSFCVNTIYSLDSWIYRYYADACRKLCDTGDGTIVYSEEDCNNPDGFRIICRDFRASYCRLNTGSGTYIDNEGLISAFSSFLDELSNGFSGYESQKTILLTELTEFIEEIGENGFVCYTPQLEGKLKSLLENFIIYLITKTEEGLNGKSITSQEGTDILSNDGLGNIVLIQISDFLPCSTPCGRSYACHTEDDGETSVKDENILERYDDKCRDAVVSFYELERGDLFISEERCLEYSTKKIRTPEKPVIIQQDITCENVCRARYNSESYCDFERELCACKTLYGPVIIEEIPCKRAMSDTRFRRFKECCRKLGAPKVDLCYVVPSPTGYCCHTGFKEIPIPEICLSRPIPDIRVDTLVFVKDNITIGYINAGNRINLEARIINFGEAPASVKYTLSLINLGTEEILQAQNGDVFIEPYSYKNIFAEFDIPYEYLGESLGGKIEYEYSVGERIIKDSVLTQDSVSVINTNTVDLLGQVFYSGDKVIEKTYIGDRIYCEMRFINDFYFSMPLRVQVSLVGDDGIDYPDSLFVYDLTSGVEPGSYTVLRSGLLHISPELYNRKLRCSAVFFDKNDRILTQFISKKALSIDIPTIFIYYPEFILKNGFSSDRLYLGTYTGFNITIENRNHFDFNNRLYIELIDDAGDVIYVFDDDIFVRRYSTRIISFPFIYINSSRYFFRINDLEGESISGYKIRIQEKNGADFTSNSFMLIEPVDKPMFFKTDVIAQIATGKCRAIIRCKNCNEGCRIVITEKCGKVLFRSCFCESCLSVWE